MTLWDRIFGQRNDAAPSPELPHGALAAAVERIDSLVNTLTGLGSATDKGAVARPDVSRRSFSMAELVALYRFNAYARRFVNQWPDQATRKGWRVVDDTQDQGLMDDEDKRLHVRARVNEAARWARLMGGAVILPVLREDVPPEFRGLESRWAQQPLDLDRVIGIDNLVVLDRSEAQPFDFVADIHDPSFRQPRLWSVSPAVSGALSGDQELPSGLFHSSRVLWFPGATLPSAYRFLNYGFGDSVLEAAWDQIRGLTSADQAAYTLTQEMKLDVVKIPGLDGLEVSDQRELFRLRMQALAQSKAINHLILLGEGDDFQTRGAPLTGWGDLKDHAREAYSAATGQPQTLAFGEAPSGLNTDGESSRRNFHDQIATYQRNDLAPPLEQLYTLLFRAKEGPTNGNEPESWRLEWEPLDELTTTQQAELEEIQAKTDAIRVAQLGYPQSQILKSRYGSKGYQADLLPIEGIDDLDVSSAAMREMERELDALREGNDQQPPPQGNGNAPELEPDDDTDEVEENEDEDEDEEQDGPRGDAAEDRGLLYVPLAPEAESRWRQLQDEVARILGPDFRRENWPHVTILFLGEIEADDVERVTEVAPSVIGDVHAWPVHAGRIAAFPSGPDGVPLVLRVWGPFGELNDRLVRALAPEIRRRQFPEFQPHATLGYLGRELTPEETAKLLQLRDRTPDGGDGDPPTWVPTEVIFRVGDVDAARFPLRLRLDATAGS